MILMICALKQKTQEHQQESSSPSERLEEILREALHWSSSPDLKLMTELKSEWKDILEVYTLRRVKAMSEKGI